MARSIAPSVWYVDNNPSYYMTGNEKYFNKLSECDMHLDIVMGDDGKSQIEGTGINKFERESGSPLYLRDVLYVVGLKKNRFFSFLFGG